MSRRTRDARSVTPSYEAVDLRQAIVQFLPRSGLGLFDFGGNGQARWVARMLAATAILMSLEAAAAITDRFEAARAAVAAMWPTRRRPGSTYGGFARALARQTPRLLTTLLPELRRRVRSLAERQSCWAAVGRWVVFGVDGSRVECPMTEANERAFGIAGKKKTGPQQFLTAIFHVASGLIWDYRRGDACASEREHLRQMLDVLPLGALLVADAGFTGYDLFAAITAGGRRSFLVRVGSNVHLLKKLLKWEYRLRGELVYLWPQKAQEKKLPPLTLRLITVRDGSRKMHLLTDVLDAKLLSDEQAEAIYAKRWGIELIYRSLKQTVGRRRLRSAAPANAAAELDWAVVGLWVLGLMSVSRIVAAGHSPCTWSVASSLRAVRRRTRAATVAARHPRPRRRCRGGGPSLAQALAAARLDPYRRTGSKTARHWPHKKREKPPGDPRARNATRAEIKLAERLRLQCAPT